MKPVELDIVEVPEGLFLMGANPENDVEAEPNEDPQRKIWLSAYKIQRTPVTIDLWNQFLKSTNYNWHFYEALHSFYKEMVNNSPSGECPITYVSWFDAYEFTKWLQSILGGSYSLPTEAQWEKACRGERGQLYPWGSEEPDDYYTLPPFSKTPISVGTRPDRQSPYGCLDMWQNVAEWCFDWFNEELYCFGEECYYNDPTKTVNPIGSTTGEFKIWRGGTNMWQTGWPRCSYRGFAKSSFRHPSLGFRVVLNL